MTTLRKKSMIMIIVGLIFLAGGTGFLFFNVQNQGERIAMIVGVFFAVGFAYLAKGMGRWQNKNLVAKDELSKKIGYAALALSFQVLLIILATVGMVNSFVGFLDHVSAKELLSYTIWLAIVLLISFQIWYEANPERTKL